ncbi:MAG: hypothetical protein ACP5FZ_11855 [Fidelibacterota bacterium]
MKPFQTLFTIIIISHLLLPQSLVFEGKFGQKQYELQNIEQIHFKSDDSLSRPSLSLYTNQGIRQFRIATIDSILFSEPLTLQIHQPSDVCTIPVSDIIRFTICPVSIPDRRTDALSGTQFITRIVNDALYSREQKIQAQILAGNFPDFLRNLITIKSEFYDLNGIAHTVEYDVMPDYLAIGSTEDFYRMPMTPQTAQAIADSFGCILPTRKLVDDIWKHATVRLDPFPYPWTEESTKVPRFRDHSSVIDSARIATGGELGELIAGIKKDVVICNALKTNPGKVAIYGWHYPSGNPIQPLYAGHSDQYVDYSHGIRLVNAVVRVDGVAMRAQNILRDSVLYKLLSDEAAPMSQPYYWY